jgi:hypothetical protein
MTEHEATQCAEAHSAIMSILEGMTYDQKAFTTTSVLANVVCEYGDAVQEDAVHAMHNFNDFVERSRSGELGW